MKSRRTDSCIVTPPKDHAWLQHLVAAYSYESLPLDFARLDDPMRGNEVVRA